MTALRDLPEVAWTPGRPRLSVVIPTRDRRDALAETLAALDAQDCDNDDVEVVVVDNAPDGVTADWLAGRRGRLRREILVEPTPGPAAARNAGWRRATAPVVFFLGDDTRPADTGVVSAHLRLHTADPRPAMAVLGLITWRADRPVSPFMHWLEHGGPQFNFDWLPAGPVSPPHHFYTPHVSIKKAALEQVGGFDERFPYAAFEDVELGLRLKWAGLELIYHPELVVEHDHPYDPRQFGERQERVGASARLMFAIHGDLRHLIDGPAWDWPAYRLARPLLEAAATRKWRFRGRRRAWKALATAGYAAGWSRAEEILARGRSAPVEPLAS